MKSERPLIAAGLLLASGLGLIFGYCHGTTNLNAAYPMATSAFHLDITTSGPAALGGVALTAVGVLSLLWALVAAVVSQIRLLFGHSSEDDRITARDRILE